MANPNTAQDTSDRIRNIAIPETTVPTGLVPIPHGDADVEAGAGTILDETKSGFTIGTDPKQHRRRWCYLLKCCSSFVCLTAIVLALVFFLGGRQIAQSSLADAHLTINRLTISKANRSGFVLQAQLDVSHVGPAGAELSAMDVDIFCSEQLFGRMHMPSTSVHALGSTTTDVPSQPFHVMDAASWQNCLQQIVRNKQVRLQLKSTVSVKAVGTTFQDVSFDNKVTIAGMDGLRDAQITALDLSNSTLTELVMHADLCVKNPSSISVSNLGDFDFALFYNGSFMGNVSTQDAQLAVTRNDVSDSSCRQLGDGYNFFKLAGVLQPVNHSGADDLMSCYLLGKSCQIVARAWHAQDDPTTLFSNALYDVDIPAVLKGDPQSVVTGLHLKQVMLEPKSENEVSMMFAADVDLQSPLGRLSQLEVLAVSLSADLEWSNEVVGHMTTPLAAVPPPRVLQGLGSIAINATSTIAIPNQGSALSRFMKELMESRMQNLTLRGSARVQAKSSALGYLMNIDIPLSTETTLSGFDSFRGSNVTVSKLDVSGGFSGGLDLFVDFWLPNPTNIRVSMGAVTMQLLTGGVRIGEISIPSLDLQAGRPSVFVNMSAKYVPPADPRQAAIAESFLSNYVNGVSQSIEVRAAADGSATQSRLFKPALSDLSVSGLLPGLSRGFVKKAMILHPSIFSLNEVPTSVVVQNPFSTSLTVTGINIEEYGCEDYSGQSCHLYYQEVLGHVAESDVDISIPARGTAVTPYYTVQIASLLSGESIQTILRVDFNHGGIVRIAGHVDVTIGQFSVRLHLEQDSVGVCSAGHTTFSSHDPHETYC